MQYTGERGGVKCIQSVDEIYLESLEKTKSLLENIIITLKPKYVLSRLLVQTFDGPYRLKFHQMAKILRSFSVILQLFIKLLQNVKMTKKLL